MTYSVPAFRKAGNFWLIEQCPVQWINQFQDQTSLRHDHEVIRNSLQWKEASGGVGSHNAPYTLFIRWTGHGVFKKIFTDPGGAGRCSGMLHDQKHTSQARHAVASPRKKGGAPPDRADTRRAEFETSCIVCDDVGRPGAMRLTEGRMSDPRGAYTPRCHLCRMPGI
ncbi:hypothetical protein [Komagataeibacter swingsii]|uniref:Uncharacterized protein n=1 Tax=Komagataeibacter swingsii TaxID=215220 RepID=A0A850P9U2_9PROT|nr:hypothetical protein [Komagataeibacter swingsii]NVN38662.1 hypothetical protein [Komagataeibacter swingsii]